MLISFIYSLRLTNNPIKGPPLGVSACPHNNMPLIGLIPDVCVCVFNLSLSITVLSPELWCCSSSWKRRSRTASDGGSSPGGDDVSCSPCFGAGVQLLPPCCATAVATCASVTASSVGTSSSSGSSCSCSSSCCSS
eukprot:COSAG01_NODE_1480_length_10161_cov_32.805804_6_plen_136_part_00